VTTIGALFLSVVNIGIRTNNRMAVIGTVVNVVIVTMVET
jgi:hypothetical protein